MDRVSVSALAPDVTIPARNRRLFLTPASLRVVLIAAAAAATGLAWFVTRDDLPANPDAELIRVLQFMTLAKGLIGAGALWMLSIRFRYPIAPRHAFAYIAGAAIMASGPGAMWTTAHIILGSVLFYAGLGVIVMLALTDGSAKWKPRSSGA